MQTYGSVWTLPPDPFGSPGSSSPRISVRPHKDASGAALHRPSRACARTAWLRGCTGARTHARTTSQWVGRRRVSPRAARARAVPRGVKRPRTATRAASPSPSRGVGAAAQAPRPTARLPGRPSAAARPPPKSKPPTPTPAAAAAPPARCTWRSATRSGRALARQFLPRLPRRAQPIPLPQRLPPTPWPRLR